MKNYKSYLSFVVIIMMNSCSSIPATTQTGEVRDVNIESTVSPEQDRISCNRGFSNEGTAVVGSNQTASICFNKAGEVKYNVRMESMLPGGEEPAKGEIIVK